METISLQVTEWQIEKMKEIKKKIGIPRSVFIRNAINLYLDRFEEKENPLYDITNLKQKELSNS